MADTVAASAPATAPAQASPKKAKSSGKKPRAKPQCHQEPEGTRRFLAAGHKEVHCRQLQSRSGEVRALHKEVSEGSRRIWRTSADEGQRLPLDLSS
ncbi:hypothetical protein L9F63_028163 [Diploptera punctata]|uniref:Uncharacterized protein n=1 Tax=Diploptera punctata TaxID=6984 RepID=A0AAD8EFC4_DIPPU|nr:hypothetical protein L9F63_028163 [Diploptera punctata]